MRRRHHALSIGLVLGLGCGPEPAEPMSEPEPMQEPEPMSEPEPVVPRRWRFGGGDRPVLSSPVVDEAGNIFVVVGVGAVETTERSSPPSFMVEAVELVSLDPSGQVRWWTVLAGPGETGVVTVHPSVRDGNVWVRHAGRVWRVAADGRVLWRLEDVPYSYRNFLSGQGLWVSPSCTALDRSGTYYVLGSVGGGGGYEELWAIDGDGGVRWRIRPALPGSTHYADPSMNQTEAPLVGPDGSVFVGCTTCAMDQVGLARVEPATGTPSLLYAQPVTLPDWIFFERLLWDGAAIRHALSGDALAVTPGGVVEDPVRSPALVVSEGEIRIEQAYDDRETLTLIWGDDALPVDIREVVPAAWSNFNVHALSATEPAGVLMALFRDLRGSGDAEAAQVVLLLVDRDGEIVWSRGDVSAAETLPLPAIGDGVIVYVERGTRALVADEAPVLRVADGPWPIEGGDPQNTRSVGE